MLPKGKVFLLAGLVLAFITVMQVSAQVPNWVHQERIRAGYSGPAPEELLRRLKQEGFNAYMMKLGAPEEQGEQIAKYSRLCKDIGLHFFVIVNTSGEHEAVTIMDKGLRRQVDKSGRERRGTCPLDERFWERVFFNRAQRAIELSKGGVLDGFVLDPETYGIDADSSPLTFICYCDNCFTGGAKAAGLNISAKDVPPSDRYKRLVVLGAVDAYDSWLQQELERILKPMAQRLRQRKPDLLLGNFLYEPTWFHQALVRAFSSEKAPAIIFRETTYLGALVNAKSSRAHFVALKANVLDVGGTWLGRMTPENQAAHAYALATSIDGYWVFDISIFLNEPGKGDPRSPYYLPLPAERYFAAFRTANEEIAKRLKDPAYISPLKFDQTATISLPPPTGEPFRQRVRGFKDLKPLAQIKPDAITPQDYQPIGEPTRLRHEATVLFFVQKGETLRFRINALQLGNYPTGTSYALFDPQGEVVAEGSIALKESKEVVVTAKASGVYTLLGMADMNPFSVTTEHPYVAYFVPQKGLSVVSHVRRLFFFVPQNVEQFTLVVVPGGGAEQCNLIVYDPTGKEVKRVEQASGSIEIDAPPEKRGKYWSFLLTRPTTGVFEDVSVRLDKRLMPFVAEKPLGLMVRESGE